MEMKTIDRWKLVAMAWLCAVLVACSVDDDPTVPYNPEDVNPPHTEAVNELIKICETNSEVKQLLEHAIRQAKEINPDVKYNPAQTLDEFFTFIDWNIRALPWDVMTGLIADHPSLYSRVDQGVGYFWFVVDQPLDELKDRGFFYPTVEFVEPFASWLTTYANSWGDWLSTSDSWNSTYYDMVANDADWGLTEGWYGKSNIWHSFNDFFARELVSPDMRPIDPVAELVSPVDSWPKATWDIDDNNQLLYPDDVNIKTAKFSDIADLIGQDSKYKEAFAGGTLTHTFLDVNDYHHYHAPVEGKLVELRTIPGVAAGGGYTLWDNDSKRYYYVNDMGFQMVETRACAIIETEDYGLVAMLPVGMSQICSVNWINSLKVGDWLEKGDEMGYFLFGGSDVVMIFQKGVEVSLMITSDGEGGYEHLLMGEAYARLTKR
ncbi:MAG: phosphatidylserine decarboxylase [Bacteroidales bacterium]|jgi:phosphatidylserine decarboxylase precursor